MKTLKRAWRKLLVLWAFVKSLYGKAPAGCCEICHEPLARGEVEVHENCRTLRSMGNG